MNNLHQETLHPARLEIEDEGVFYNYDLVSTAITEAETITAEAAVVAEAEAITADAAETEFDPAEDTAFDELVQGLVESDAVSEGGVDMQDFKLSAIEQETPYAFPEMPEKPTDVDGDVSKIIDWHLTNIGISLDNVRETITTEAQARDWLQFKMLVAAGKQMRHRVGIMDKWDFEIELRETVDQFVESCGKESYYGD